MVLRALVLPKHLAQVVLGMDAMKRQRPVGLAVPLHWKGYLVVRDGEFGQGSIGPPKWGANPDAVSLAARGGGLNPEKRASGFSVDFGGENLGIFKNTTLCRFWATPKRGPQKRSVPEKHQPNSAAGCARFAFGPTALLGVKCP